MPNYDPNNIFAKILRGELPSYKVYEDDKALAFLDIMPRSPGHTLVLPKAPARNILDVGADDLAHVMTVAQKISKAIMIAFECRRHHHTAIQRRRRRTGGVPPACPRHPSQNRGRHEAAGEREGKTGRSGRACQETSGGYCGRLTKTKSYIHKICCSLRPLFLLKPAEFQRHMPEKIV